jgi:tetratricopeptide (TPR) repeat protein
MTRVRALLLVAVTVAIAGCAPKASPVPPAITAPRFPEFIQPLVPPGLGTPAALERHQFAWRWLQAGDLRAAERNFTAALKQAPAFYPAEVGLGYVALAGKKHKEALLHFDRAVVANPRYAPALGGRAEALLAMGEVDEAVVSIEAALKEDPNLAPLRSRLEVLRFKNQQADIARARKLAQSGALLEARAAYLTALEASPEAGFLLRELADVERRAGNLEGAIEYASKAATLEPEDVRGHMLLGELYESQGQLAKAADAYAAAAAVQPDPALSDKVAALRARAAFDAMPEEYRGIEASPSVTRAQLAALLAVRLDDLLAANRRVNAVVITDTRGSWAAGYILTVARAGVMEVYANHTFQPDALVRRVDLAQAASRVLELIASRSPQLASTWRAGAKRTFPDIGPRHLRHAAVSLAVAAGVMTTLEDGSFGLTRPVTGAEAVAAVTKLQELAGQPAR